MFVVGVYVVSIATYIAYLVWIFQTQEGGMRWFLMAMPLVVSGGLGFKWYRDQRRWLDE